MKPPENPKKTLGKGTKDGKLGSALRESRNQTAAWPAQIQSKRVYRIGVMSFWDTRPSSLRGVLADAFPKIFEGHDGPRLALLPGVVLTGKRWPAGTDEVCEAAEKNQVTVLFECMEDDGRRAYRAFSSAKGLLPVEIYQRFADSARANANPELVAGLVADCGKGKERTVNLDGLPVGLLACGENNIFENLQINGNEARVRHHPGADLFGHVRVVFNGAHTRMGNWGKLERRFEYLSREKRWAFYATNINGETWGASAVRAYYDGKKIADSSMRTSMNSPVPVRSVADNPARDRFIALALNIPGTMLG
jgi:hypothetical protein